MANIRKTGGREELDALWARVNSLVLLFTLSTLDAAGIADGTTAGKLKTANAVNYTIGNLSYSKAAADDLWDLTAEADTGEDEYRAYWLLLDDAGAASIEAGKGAGSESAALRALPDLAGDAAVIGVFVAGPECDFDDAGGLEAQGKVYDGIPEGVPVGVPRYTYQVPRPVRLVAP